MSKAITIDEFAATYRISDIWACECIHLAYFSALPIHDAVDQAARARFAYRNLNSGGVVETKQHSHIRLREADLWLCSHIMLSRLADVIVCAQKGFEPLRAFIEQQTRAVFVQAGPLYAYDAAEAIGSAFGVQPRHVYLHGPNSGPRKAAQMLGVLARSDIKTPWVEVSDLPPAWHHLEPYEAETALCALHRSHRHGELLISQTALDHVLHETSPAQSSRPIAQPPVTRRVPSCQSAPMAEILTLPRRCRPPAPTGSAFGRA